MEKIACLIGLLLFCWSLGVSSDTLHISIVSDNDIHDEQHWFEELIKDEIESLLKSKVTILFEEVYCAGDVVRIQRELDHIYSNDHADIVIAANPIGSSLLALRDSFSIPSISAVILDRSLQDSPITPKGTSGKHNFTYVESPFDVMRDLRTLFRLRPFEKVAIISNGVYEKFIPEFSDYFMASAESLNTELIITSLQNSVSQTLSSIPDDVQAAYFLPVDNGSNHALITSTITALHERNIQTMAILGERYMDMGILMAYEAEDNLVRIPRRIALDVMKIFEGANGADLPIRISSFSENLMINLAASRASGIYPGWDLLNESYAVNFKEVETSRTISLQEAIAMALKENLDIKIAQYDNSLAKVEIDLAKSDRLPQADVNTNLAILDNQTATASFGTRGQANWIGGLSVSQVIFAEPVNANIEIQKLLERSKFYELEQTQLDVILDVADAYLNTLQARGFLDIQADNLKLTKENYDIAKAKQKVGYGTASDLYRWESLLAQANSEFNLAIAQFDQAHYVLNQLLNQPIGERMTIKDVRADSDFLMIADERVTQQISNLGAFEQFSEFMVSEAMRSLPELKQIDMNINAQRRLQKSYERARYLPSVSASASYDLLLHKWALPKGTEEMNNINSWTIGLGAAFPITQGGRRINDIEKGKLTLDKLDFQKDNLSNQLELRVRSTLQQASTSYSNLELTRTSATAAMKNFEIAQDSYSQGIVNITYLIDAQNASLQANLTSTNAEYQFIYDFLALERSIGAFYFLMDQNEKDSFIVRYNDFMTSKK